MTKPSDTAYKQALRMAEKAGRVKRNAVSRLVALTDPDNGLPQPFLDQALELMSDIWAEDFDDRLLELDRAFDNAYDEMEARSLRAAKNAKDKADADAIQANFSNWHRALWNLGMLRSARRRARNLEEGAKAMAKMADDLAANGF